jgi:hypothetical protein
MDMNQTILLYELVATISALVVGSILLAIGWRKGSSILSAIACALSVLTGMGLQPWSVFEPSVSYGPWPLRWQLVSGIWAVQLLLAGYCLVSIARKRYSHAIKQGAFKCSQ